MFWQAFVDRSIILTPHEYTLQQDISSTGIYSHHDGPVAHFTVATLFSGLKCPAGSVHPVWKTTFLA